MTAAERRMQDTIDNLELEVQSLSAQLDDLSSRLGSWPQDTNTRSALDVVQEHDTRFDDLEGRVHDVEGTLGFPLCPPTE